MKKEVYEAAVRGDRRFLRDARINDVESTKASYSDEDLLAVTCQGNNIIQVAAQYGQLGFIKDALASFSTIMKKHIICQVNSNGDTPLHLAAIQSNKAIAEHLVDSYQALLSPLGKEISKNEVVPWVVQNSKGNTPLHVALMNGGKSIQVAAYLLDIGPEVASYTNDRKETPLHLAVHYDTKGGEFSTINMINTLNGQGAALTYTKSLFEEDSISLIKLLLEKNSTVCCLQNADGMTPLLNASVNTYLAAVEAIINHCPDSIEISDFKGRNILHLMNLPASVNARELFRKLGISVLLMDQQDDDGNTPMHIAVMNHNFGMVKAMFENGANFTLINYVGSSAAALIQPDSNLLHYIMRNENMKKQSEDSLMSTYLYEAVAKGNWEDLTQKLEECDSDKLFLTQLPDGSNIFHLTVESCPLEFKLDSSLQFLERPCLKEQFIIKALKIFPILSCQTNRHGETPLHLAMSHQFLEPDGMLFAFLKEEHFEQMKVVTNYFPLPPWKAKDIDGSTLLHLALKYGRFKFAEHLIMLDAEVVGQNNNSKGTPLHMLCQNVGKEECIDMVDLLLKQDMSLAYAQDAHGFTPLLRAIHANLLHTAIRILHHCPQSVRQYDSQGRNIFHWIKIDKDYDRKRIEELCEVVPHVEIYMRMGDDEKNTPLHLALTNGEYGTAMFLMKRLNELNCKELRYDMRTIPDILAASQDVPRWFGDYISSKVFELPREFIWSNSRSQYGIRKTQIKDYMNPVGLVAALLTTITFTAAFTVPGGYNDMVGTPFLVNTVAFRIFILSDVVGMCSSMMVLFCLLWFLVAYHDDDREELVLVDLTIGLLQVSFYATLVAFMTGVYATTISHIPWLAISTCILCTTIILLMRKKIVLGFVLKVFFYIHFSIKFGAVSVTHYTKRIVRCLGSKDKV